MRRTWLFWWVAIALWPKAARAEEGALEVRLTYAAAPECPQRDAFVRWLQARSPHVRGLDTPRETTSPATHFEEVESPSSTTPKPSPSSVQRAAERRSWDAVVLISPRAPRGFTAQVRFGPPVAATRPRESPTTVRQVGGETCSTVADAAALVLALVIERTAANEMASSDPSESTAGTKSRRPHRRNAPTPEWSSAPARWDSSIVFDWGVSWGATPVMAPTMGIALEASQRSHHPLGFAFRGGLVADELSTTLDGESFRFRSLRAAGDACVSPQAVIALDLCVHGEGGVVNFDLLSQSARARWAPWVIAGGRGALRIAPAGPVSFEIASVVAVPIVRNDFYFKDEATPRFRTRALVGELFFGLGIALPQ